MKWQTILVHFEFVSGSQSKQTLQSSVNRELVLGFEIFHALVEKIWQFLREIMDAYHFEGSNELLLDEFILHHGKNCSHDIFSNALLISLVNENIVESAGGNFSSMFCVPKLPMDLY